MFLFEGVLSVAAVDAHHLAIKRGNAFQGRMNFGSLGGRVIIAGAGNDVLMSRVFAVQAKEVQAVQCQNGAALLGGKAQHVFVRNLLIGLARLKSGENIVPQRAKLQDHAQRKIFVRVKMCHQASWFSWMAFSTSALWVFT